MKLTMKGDEITTSFEISHVFVSYFRDEFFTAVFQLHYSIYIFVIFVHMY